MKTQPQYLSGLVILQTAMVLFSLLASLLKAERNGAGGPGLLEAGNLFLSFDAHRFLSLKP